VCLYSADGQETILSFLTKGDFFGEMALFLESTRTADVVAMEPTEVFQIHRQQFYALLQQHFNITRKIFETLCLRLKQANFSIDSLAHLDVSGRLARFLIEQAKTAGVRMNDWTVIPRLTHQEIAGKVVTSRETVSRLLKQLECSGCLMSKRDGIYIHARFLK
jgi:CRP-like cAMP-binding protein